MILNIALGIIGLAACCRIYVIYRSRRNKPIAQKPYYSDGNQRLSELKSRLKDAKVVYISDHYNSKDPYTNWLKPDDDSSLN